MWRRLLRPLARKVKPAPEGAVLCFWAGLVVLVSWMLARGWTAVAAETGLSKTAVLGIVKAAGLELQPGGHQRELGG